MIIILIRIRISYNFSTHLHRGTVKKRLGNSPNLFNLCFKVSKFAFTSRTNSYLWVLERHVDGKTRSKARQGLEVGSVGQRPAALSEYGEGQWLEVLPVDVTLSTVHRLQQILAGNNLMESNTRAFSGRSWTFFSCIKTVALFHLIVIIWHFVFNLIYNFTNNEQLFALVTIT